MSMPTEDAILTAIEAVEALVSGEVPGLTDASRDRLAEIIAVISR